MSVDSQQVSATSPKCPKCPKCGRLMVRRTARRGANVGREFWGCPEFPRCRAMLRDEPSAGVRRRGSPAAVTPRRGIWRDEPSTGVPVGEDNPVAVESPASPSVDGIRGTDGEGADSESSEKSGGFLAKMAKTVDKIGKTVDKAWRWYLESDEPDATGRWDTAHRRRMLSYVHRRDGGRCGLCAGETKLKGAQIEHIVPKVFAVFDVAKGGTAKQGTRYKSRLHRIDNLQVAHSYCNKRKGNTSKVSKWRHPVMPQLTVADADDGRTFVLPWKPPAKSNKRNV